jgi:hypothetical protein
MLLRTARTTELSIEKNCITLPEMLPGTPHKTMREPFAGKQ